VTSIGDHLAVPQYIISPSDTRKSMALTTSARYMQNYINYFQELIDHTNSYFSIGMVPIIINGQQ